MDPERKAAFPLPQCYKYKAHDRNPVKSKVAASAKCEYRYDLIYTPRYLYDMRCLVNN